MNDLQHTMSTTMVFQTEEYSRFKMLVGNRELNDTKIKRIIKEIENGVDLLEYYPIQVAEKNKRLEIVDGQHRFYICKKLRKPVHYIIVKREITLPDIAKVNSNVEKWRGKDFINCYTQLENDHYKKLQQIMDKYPVPLTTAISMLQSGKVNEGGGTKDNFEGGQFKVSHYDYTVQVFDYCLQFDFPGKFQRAFISALSRILQNNKVKMEDVIEKVKENHADLQVQPGWKEYLVHLEVIFNKRKINRVPIY